VQIAGSQHFGGIGVPFRVVQPWGPDKIQQNTILSEHSTAAAAFAEIDRLSSEMVRTGAPADAIELVVIDVERATIIRRSGTH
jgi:hypothetical protein